MALAASAVPARPFDAGLPLALEHEAQVEAWLGPLRATHGSACLSEFTFSNLYLFRHVHAYRFLPGPWPCIAGLTYDGSRHLLPLFDVSAAPPPVLQALLKHHDCLYPVPEQLARRLDPGRFALSASDDDADYLYLAQNFREYRGELLRKKRQLMRQLLRQSTVTSAPLEAQRLEDARALVTTWMQDKEKGEGEADEAACLEALALARRFGLDGRIYYADGEPAGFLIAQRLAAGTAAMRFAKGSDRYKGIYQFMFHDYVTRTPGVTWINFEQDLGLANFRQTKRSYQPYAMLAKFRVMLRA